MQRPARVGCGLCIQRARLGQHLLAVDADPGPHISVALLHACQASAGERFSRKRAVLQVRHGLGG